MRNRVTRTGGPTADVRFCLVFPREALSIPVMRRVLGDTLGRLGLDEECIADLVLAVTEACTNVLLHSGPGRPYEVVAHVGRERCLLEVVDSGRGFDPAGIPQHRPSGWPVIRLRHRLAHGWPSAPVLPDVPSVRHRFARAAGGARARSGGRDVARVAESGRGLAIMRACVDDVSLRSKPGHGTVVSLRKRIEWRSDAPLAHPEAAPLRDAG
jgi:serine/threonine-protein kinase RsbW